ncbi:MAG: hypothetical protein AB9836_04590 [Aminipila sp.]
MRDTNTGENDIAHNAKYHCFEDGVSLCGKYTQVTKFFKNDIESGEIAMRPEIACKVCRKKWMKQFQVES